MSDSERIDYSREQGDHIVPDNAAPTPLGLPDNDPGLENTSTIFKA